MPDTKTPAPGQDAAGGLLQGLGSLAVGLLQDVPYAIRNTPYGGQISVTHLLSGQARRDRMIDETTIQLRNLQMMKVVDEMQERERKRARLPVLAKKVSEVTGYDPELLEAMGHGPLSSFTTNALSSQESFERQSDLQEDRQRHSEKMAGIRQAHTQSNIALRKQEERRLARWKDKRERVEDRRKRVDRIEEKVIASELKREVVDPLTGQDDKKQSPEVALARARSAVREIFSPNGKIKSEDFSKLSSATEISKSLVRQGYYPEDAAAAAVARTKGVEAAFRLPITPEDLATDKRFVARLIVARSRQIERMKGRGLINEDVVALFKQILEEAGIKFTSLGTMADEELENLITEIESETR